MCVLVYAGALYVLKKLCSLSDRNLLHGPALSGSKAVSWSRPLSMSAVLRVKDVTRSTLNDLLMAVLTSALRRYLVRCGVRHPRDLTATLLVDLQPTRPCLERTPRGNFEEEMAWNGLEWSEMV